MNTSYCMHTTACHRILPHTNLQSGAAGAQQVSEQPSALAPAPAPGAHAHGVVQRVGIQVADLRVQLRRGQ